MQLTGKNPRGLPLCGFSAFYDRLIVHVPPAPALRVPPVRDGLSFERPPHRQPRAPDEAVAVVLALRPLGIVVRGEPFARAHDVYGLMDPMQPLLVLPERDVEELRNPGWGLMGVRLLL